MRYLIPLFLLAACSNPSDPNDIWCPYTTKQEVGKYWYPPAAETVRVSVKFLAYYRCSSPQDTLPQH